MKRAVVLVFLLASAAVAQQSISGMHHRVSETSIIAGQDGPSYSDRYCSGFLAEKRVPKLAEVIGGWDTPEQTRFADRNYVYLTGSNFQPGARYSLLREVQDPNLYEMYKGQHALLHRTGHMYADVAQLRILQVHGRTAITQVEFSCGDALPGDIALPFAQRPEVKYRKPHALDRFAPPNGKLVGQIVMAKDFDNQVGNSIKVYLNVGADQGVKPGDYFRITRRYEDYHKVEVDELSFQGVMDDTTYADLGKVTAAHLKEFPRMSLGEMVVLSVTPHTSVGMVTTALQSMHLGDRVELEEPVDDSASSQSASASGSGGPTVSCSANPATVRAGESATITCEGSSPDNRPLQYSFTSDHGRVIPRGNSAVLDTSAAGAGPVSVVARVMDDRNQSNSATSVVNVEAAEPTREMAAASKLHDLEFKPSSAYVNNVSKAMLDDVALRLQQDQHSTITIVGTSAKGEPASLADRRARNAADYLIKSKGIDTQRVEVSTSEQPGEKAEVWWVPTAADAPKVASK
jgi:outer membrane protein OmpA-like peptidoglycan-associated protein